MLKTLHIVDACLAQDLDRVGLDDITHKAPVFEDHARDLGLKLRLQRGDAIDDLQRDAIGETDDQCSGANDIDRLAGDLSLLDRNSEVQTVLKQKLIEDIQFGSI